MLWRCINSNLIPGDTGERLRRSIPAGSFMTRGSAARITITRGAASFPVEIRPRPLWRQVRSGLTAGGRRIPTLGPSRGSGRAGGSKIDVALTGTEGIHPLQGSQHSPHRNFRRVPRRADVEDSADLFHHLYQSPSSHCRPNATVPHECQYSIRDYMMQQLTPKAETESGCP